MGGKGWNTDVASHRIALSHPASEECPVVDYLYIYILPAIGWPQLKKQESTPRKPCPAAATWRPRAAALIGRPLPSVSTFIFSRGIFLATPLPSPCRAEDKVYWRLSVLWAKPFREPGPQPHLLDGMAAAHRPIRPPDSSPCTLCSLPVERVLSLFRRDERLAAVARRAILLLAGLLVLVDRGPRC